MADSPRFIPGASHHARHQAQKALLIAALLPIVKTGTCVVKTTMSEPLNVTRWLLKKGKP